MAVRHRFIFSTYSEKAFLSRGKNLGFRIYRLSNNDPKFICFHEVNTASYKGDESSVMDCLRERGEIPKKYTGYYGEHDDALLILKV